MGQTYVCAAWLCTVLSGQFTLPFQWLPKHLHLILTETNCACCLEGEVGQQLKSQAWWDAAAAGP